MEQIFFIVLVAVVGLIRLLSQVMEKKRNEEAAKRGGPTAAAEPTATSSRRAPAETEEERIRRFMDALGVPTAQAAPPPTQRPQPLPAEPSRRRTIQPVDSFPRPRRDRPRPTAPSLPEPVAPLPPPLPTEPTGVRTEQRRKVAQKFNAPSDFEVRDIDDDVAEDLISHSGIASASQRTPATAAAAGPGARLATPGGLRDAIVLREIFGPPRSLQALDRPIGG